MRIKRPHHLLVYLMALLAKEILHVLRNDDFLAICLSIFDFFILIGLLKLLSDLYRHVSASKTKIGSLRHATPPPRIPALKHGGSRRSIDLCGTLYGLAELIAYQDA